ncbi:hypothetical protein ElyMa_005261100 [Elysia marginata]|uniref:Uncharacterized protein n=1 Tax=Elysia marginata TaxID=1093978 RepID=A0AAV4K180_9GAST|nr:hypothetical protein ElyMa_005261100 [Elysia marginata]
MRTQGIKRWNKEEQLILSTSAVTAQVEKKNQRTLTPEWMETSNLEDLMMTKNLEIYIEKENFQVIVGRLLKILSPLQKGTAKLCQRQFTDRVEQQFCTTKKRMFVHRLQKKN